MRTIRCGPVPSAWCSWLSWLMPTTALRLAAASMRNCSTGAAVSRCWLAIGWTAELETLAPLAAELELADWLAPLQAVLANGNQAQQWLIAHAAGTAVAPLIAAGASAMQQSETELMALLATDGAPALG